MRGTEKRAPAQSSIWFAYLVRSYTLPSSLNPGGTEQQTRVDSCNIRRQANINISLKQWIAIEAFDAIRRCQYSNAPFSPPDTQIIRNKKYYWQTSLFLHWFPFSLFPGRLSRQHLYPNIASNADAPIWQIYYAFWSYSSLRLPVITSWQSQMKPNPVYPFSINTREISSAAYVSNGRLIFVYRGYN
jgi:hypothetical protein